VWGGFLSGVAAGVLWCLFLKAHMSELHTYYCTISIDATRNSSPGANSSQFLQNSVPRTLSLTFTLELNEAHW
jgi:hypothetical protein